MRFLKFQFHILFHLPKGKINMNSQFLRKIKMSFALLFCLPLFACSWGAPNPSKQTEPKTAQQTSSQTKNEGKKLEDLPEPTGFKLGNLVFNYLQYNGKVYTSTSEKVESSDELWKIEVGKEELQALLLEHSYEKLAEVQKTCEDIPQEALEANGFSIGDTIYRNKKDKTDYLYVVTETPKSIFYEVSDDEEVYNIVVLRPWSENELEHRAK